jgi:hypothetical protein
MAYVTTLSDMGGVPNAEQVADAAMTSGSATLTSASGPFTGADVGKKIVVTGAGASGAKLVTTISAFVSATQVTLAAAASTTVSATGATWGTDCSAAFQAALDAIATAGGGGLVIDGSYLLTAAVSKNFLNMGSAVQILGFGSNDRLYIACPATDAAITLNNVVQLLVHGVTFVGTPKERNDAKWVIDLHECVIAAIEHCGFYGLGSIDDPNGTIVRSLNSDLRTLNNFFGGCAANSGRNTAVVDHVDWRGISHDGDQFWDYGQLGPILHIKTPIGSPVGWIRVRDHIVASPDNIREQGLVQFRNLRIDEGSIFGIFINPAGTIDRVHIAGLEVNVSSSTGGCGVYVQKVDQLVIERSWAGYTTNTRDFTRLLSCGNVLVDRCKTGGGVTQITANTVTNLIVRDTPGITSQVLTSVGNFQKISSATIDRESILIAASDEVTPIAAGTAKVTFRMPYAFVLQQVRASLTTASTSGLVTVDINEAGTSILSTKLTVDANEKSSTTAATPAVISDSALLNDAEITIDIDAAGTNAAGLKVYLIGYKS